MRVTLVAALSRNRVIGREGRIPWHISEDLKRFKRLTTGHTIVMGRKTWESLGRPLPNRTNVVITRNAAYDAPGATVVGSLDEALKAAEDRGEDEVFVIGGGEIYRLALHLADRLELTLVDADVEGDATFPAFDEEAWREVAHEEREQPADERNPVPLRYAFVTLERRT